MKKIKRFLTIGFSFLLTLCVSIGITACKSIEPFTKEDLIPETLGEAEGLYLYYNNYRSFTDGSNTERLLNDITVDGVTYTTEEYSIEQIEYMTGKKEIFYSIKTKKEDEEEKYFLWHYNYDTKENGLMRTFSYRIEIRLSEEYVFSRSRDYSTYVEGVLFDGNLNFIQDGLESYNLKGNILYSYTVKENWFYWWKNEQFFSLQVKDGRVMDSNILIRKKYAYLFPDYSVYAIDLDTGEYMQTTFGGNEKLSNLTKGYGVPVTSGENTYFITYTRDTESEYPNMTINTGCYLWKLCRLKAERIYAFPEKYQVKFSSSCNEEFINFQTIYCYTNWFDKKRKREKNRAYYDINKGVFVDRKVQEIEEIQENFRIGEYEFYTKCVYYGGWGDNSSCYYLHRVKDGKDEILQYFFDEDEQCDLNPIEFDDIHIK